MRILINCSNLKAGGGLQVADSICRELRRFPQHRFTVVLSTCLEETGAAIEEYDNVEVAYHNTNARIGFSYTGRDRCLDGLVKRNGIDTVMTVFGPSLWKPKCPHLCGFARGFLVMPESPYFENMGQLQLLVNMLSNMVYAYYFQRSARHFFTENEFVSKRLKEVFKEATVYTVTNYYNQVFDHPEKYKVKHLPPFSGITLLTVSDAYPHKNLEITERIVRVLKVRHPDFHLRFVVTIDREDYHANIKGIEDSFLFIGKVGIYECPFLYKQCEVSFQPSLLECFSATYSEAMKMERPIVTTDLGFARSICGDAACYYNATSADAAADAIYHVVTDYSYSQSLIEAGKQRLKTFDNYEQRANKLISIVEEIGKNPS